MKAIRRFNNNLILCVDEAGTEFIARGKGIGFHEIPYEPKLSQIERTYYDVNPAYISVIETIPDQFLSLATEIVDFARMQLDQPLSSNIVFTLADHLQMAVQRAKKNIRMSLPVIQDIEHLFEDEYDIGEYGVRLVRKKLHVTLMTEEAAFIALHIINGENEKGFQQQEADNRLIEEIVQLIEQNIGIHIERASFNYSRFVSHMQYLFKRSRNNEQLETENEKLINQMIKEYPNIYECALDVRDLIADRFDHKLGNEEILYLILHINRLCSREECYR